MTDDLERHHQSYSGPRIYAGIVTGTDDNDGTQVITFSVGNVLTDQTASPLKFVQGVVKGDPVLIYSMEGLFNNSFFYQPMKTEGDALVGFKYGKSTFNIDPSSGKFSITLGKTSLFTILDDLLTALSVQTVATPMGPSTPGFVNKVDFTNVKTAIGALLM